MPQDPRDPAGGRALSVVRPDGSLAQDGRALGQSQEDEKRLWDSVDRWHRGKLARVPEGKEKRLPWVSIELLDAYSQELVHPIDYLCPETSTDEVCQELWDRMRDETRRQRSGGFSEPVHEFVVKCNFADLDDDRKYDYRTFERCGVACALREQRDWGRQSSFAPSRYGKLLATHPDPHRVMGEIQFIDLHVRGVQSVMDRLLEGNRILADRLDKKEKNEDAILQRERNVKKMEREEKWENAKQEAIVGGIKTVTGRLGKIAPPAMMRLADAFADKLGGKRKLQRETGDEVNRKSFRVLIVLIRAAKKRAEEKLLETAKANGYDGPPPELSMDAFLDILSNEFKIDRDHPMFEDVVSVITEAEVENIRAEVEADARGPIVVEQAEPGKDGKP